MRRRDLRRTRAAERKEIRRTYGRRLFRIWRKSHVQLNRAMNTGKPPKRGALANYLGSG